MTPDSKTKTRQGRWAKGQSGNPGGRPKSLVLAVRETVGDDGEKLVKALYVMALGSDADRVKVFGEAVKVGARERIQAITELMDRGFGKSMAAIELSTPDDKPIRVVFGGRYQPAE